MNSKEIDKEESPSLSLSQDFNKSFSELNRMMKEAKSQSECHNIINELQELELTEKRKQDSSIQPLEIHEVTDKLAVAEKVGHLCDLCQIDLATDPERPNGSLPILQETCVLACGHVYHFKCLKSTTLDLDNCFDPSCILCIS